MIAITADKIFHYCLEIDEVIIVSTFDLFVAEKNSIVTALKCSLELPLKKYLPSFSLG
jgi:hypothetical protein